MAAISFGFSASCLFQAKEIPDSKRVSGGLAMTLQCVGAQRRVATWLLCFLAMQMVLNALCMQRLRAQNPAAGNNSEEATAVFAGGCFWCVESAFEKCPGVTNVVSGYSGGRSQNPNYKNYAAGGHREVVLISYDPSQVTYAGLVGFLIKHINPWDRAGSFIDRGKNYSPAIYFANPEEKEAAEGVIKAIDQMKVYKKPINVPVVARKAFWPAEDYHQNYHLTNPGNYMTYRQTCGRDPFIKEHWGENADRLTLPGAFPKGATGKRATQAGKTEAGSGTGNSSDAAKGSDDLSQKSEKPWLNFEKPKPAELKRKLTRSQYQVTQENETEQPFANAYWNKHEDGIYVDVVSGEPLFLSIDKFDSGTGWPSFVRGVDENCYATLPDYTHGTQRVEVRSRIADSHLGHVFDDGPPQEGGLRFCINSASLRFIPLKDMERMGYGEYLKRFENRPRKAK
jgi:peptide methionine sulfoxide reductase msrA/msrB